MANAKADDCACVLTPSTNYLWEQFDIASKLAKPVREKVERDRQEPKRRKKEQREPGFIPAGVLTGAIFLKGRHLEPLESPNKKCLWNACQD